MGIGPLYVDRHDDASSRARETKWRPSGTNPEETCAMPFSMASACEIFRLGFSKTYHSHVPIHSSYSFVRSGL